MKEQDKKTVETTTTEEQQEKGFTAYLEIYGDFKMLAKVFKDFEGDPDELEENDLNDISIYLVNISGIPETAISHSILKIVPDEEDEEETDEE